MKKNQKEKLVDEKLDKTKLAIGAVGPGSENIGIFSAKQNLIRSAPGSDITGVPESEINAIAFFLESFSIR